MLALVEVTYGVKSWGFVCSEVPFYGLSRCLICVLMVVLDDEVLVPKRGLDKVLGFARKNLSIAHDRFGKLSIIFGLHLIQIVIIG